MNANNSVHVNYVCDVTSVNDLFEPTAHCTPLHRREVLGVVLCRRLTLLSETTHVACSNRIRLRICGSGC